MEKGRRKKNLVLLTTQLACDPTLTISKIIPNSVPLLRPLLSLTDHRVRMQYWNIETKCLMCHFTLGIIPSTLLSDTYLAVELERKQAAFSIRIMYAC